MGRDLECLLRSTVFWDFSRPLWVGKILGEGMEKKL
jgi:hypothetical protein